MRAIFIDTILFFWAFAVGLTTVAQSVAFTVEIRAVHPLDSAQREQASIVFEKAGYDAVRAPGSDSWVLTSSSPFFPSACILDLRTAGIFAGIAASNFRMDKTEDCQRIRDLSLSGAKRRMAQEQPDRYKEQLVSPSERLMQALETQPNELFQNLLDHHDQK